MSEQVTLRMFVMDELPNALKVTGVPAQPPPGVALFYEWIPRKVISGFRVERIEQAAPGHFMPIEITLSEWFVERRNLWEFVRGSTTVKKQQT